MSAGTVSIKVVPNADGFHKKAKRDIENGRIDPVGVKIDPDTMAWEKVKQDIRDFDNTVVNIRLNVDSRALENTLREIDESDQTIERRLEIDDSEARKKLDDLAKVPEAEDGAIKRYLLIDHHEADQQLRGFEQKWDAPLVRKIVVDAVGFGQVQKDMLGLGEQAQDLYGAMNRQSQRQIPGIRNGIDVDSALLDVQNFMPRMIKSMNRQFDLGMKQVYDQYFTTIGKMYKASAKPFINLRADWNQAKNFDEFFSSMADRSIVSRKRMRELSHEIKAGMSNLREFGVEIKKLPQNFTQATRRISFAWNLMRKNMPDKLFPTIPNRALRDVYREIRNIATLPAKLAAEAKSMDRIFTVFLKNKVINLFGKAKKAAIGFSSALGEIGDGMKTSFREIRSGASVLVEALGSFLPAQVIVAARRAGESFATPFFNSVKRGLGRGINALGGFYSAFQFLAEDIGGKMGPTLIKSLGGSVQSLRAEISGVFSGLFSRATGGVSAAFGKVGGILSGSFRGIKYMGGDLADSLIKPLATFGQRATRYLTLPFQNMTRIIGRSTVVFGVLRKAMSRISNVAAGATRLAIGSFAKLSGFLLSSLVPAVMAVVFGIMAMGGQVVLGAIMALGGAIQSAIGGALLMVPALVGAAGASFAVLKVGVEGFGTAFKSAFSAETAEEFEQAIADLPPAMQAISRSVREFKPLWDDTVKTIQSNMFEGLDDNFNSAIGALLPIFSKGAAKMATSWNKAFEGVLDTLASAESQVGTQKLMDGIVEMSKAMEPVLANLVAALGMLAAEGAKFLGPIGQWAADKSDQFKNWAESLQKIDPETGKSFFDGIIESAKTNAGHLGRIFGGAFGTLGNVFKAGAEGGQGMLGGMGQAMQELKEHTSEGNEGFEKMVGFMKQTTDFASQLGQVVGPIFSGALSVFTTLASVGSGAVEGLGTLLDAIVSGLEGFESLGEGFGENIGNIFAALAPSVESLLVTLQPIIASLGQGLDNALTPALEALAPVMEKLEPLGAPLGKLLETVGTALGTMLVAAMPLIESALTFIEPLIPILDKVFFYIGEIVGAVLEAITPFFTMRDEAVAGLVEALGPLVDVLGKGLLGVIEALAPLFPILGGLFAQVINAVTPLIEPLTKIAFVLFNALIDVIKMVMPIIPPIADLIGSLASKLSDILVVALNWLLNTWNKVWPTVAAVLKFVIDNIIVPGIKILSAVIDGLASFIKWAIEWVIVPVLHVLSGVFGAVIGTIKWIIENVAQPAIDALKVAFEKAVDFIGNVWDGLKKLFAEPISFLIDVVMNKAIVPAWNWVMDLVGAEDRRLAPYKKPSDMNFSQGGVLPGYSVGKDNYNFVETRTGARLGLAGGEGIMRQEFVSAVGGKKGIDRLNEDARHGRLGVEYHDRSSAAHSKGGVFSLGNFASGGIIEAMTRIVQQKYPMLQMTSGLRLGDSGNHGRGLAADFSNGSGNTPAQLGLAQDIAKTYPNSMELIYDSPGWSNNIKNGANVGPFGQFYTMAQAGNHQHHVHWAMNTPPTMPFGGGVFEGGSDGSGGGGNWFSQAMSWIKEKVSAVTNFFTKPFNDLQAKVAGFGKFGATSLDMGKKLGNEVKDNLIAKVKEHMPFGGGGNGSGPLGSPADVEVYRAGIIDAFKRQGEDPLAWRVDALLRQIWTESKGDPNIAQQIVDVNGTGESAGVGLYQVIPSTWAGYRDPELPDDRRNVEAAHNFAVRYFRDRHHWNTGPGGVGLPNTGWKDGGVLPSFFDRGGEATGTGMLMKNILNPERVLSPAQTKAFNSFVYGLMPQLIEAFRKNPTDLAGGFRKLTAGVNNIYREMQEGKIVKLQAGIADTFKRRLAGERIGNPLDSNYDSQWLQRNGGKLKANAERAGVAWNSAFFSPKAYLEAEERAKAQIEEEKEAKAKAEAKAEEERKKAEEDKSDSSGDDGEDVEKVADKVADVESAVEDQTATISEAESEKIKLEEERAKKEDEAEKARIEKAKADGSYYYGYKVFNEKGESPDKIERTPEEEGVKGFLGSVSQRTGLGETFTNLSSWFDTGRSIAEAGKVAAPAWVAALNGDPSGLAHNVAVGQARVLDMGAKEVSDLGPDAIAGIIEMAIAGSSAQSGNAPFIGEVNSGMTQAELMQTLETYEMRRARKGTGTTRVR